MLTSLTFLFLFFNVVSGGLYNPASDSVVSLDAKTFKKHIKSNPIVFTEFYAPWCGHCKSLAPEWKKAAAALEGIVSITAVDADEHKSLGSTYGVTGYPTIKLFIDGKATEYNGARTAKGVVDAALSEVRKLTSSRLGGKTSSSSSTKSDKKKKDKKNKSGAVVTLTDSNFNELVMQSGDLWIVEFYAPWCGHCKSLEPEYKKAAKELKGSGVKLGALDATIHKNMATEYGVKGFPTLKVFRPGVTSAKEAMDYNGPRTADGIVSFSLAEFEKAGGRAPPQLFEFMTQPVMEDTCEGSAICVIAFLPHILDGQKVAREKYLAEFASAAKSVRGKPFRFGWIEAGAQPDWEATLGLTFGFPTVVAASLNKNRYAIQRGSFTAVAIKRFLTGLTSGSEKTTPVDAFPVLKTVTAWDGKDGVLPSEDDEEDDDDILKEMLAGKEEL